MYNRYIPQEVDYIPVESETVHPTGQEKAPFSLKNLLASGMKPPLQGSWWEEGRDPLNGLLQSLNLEGVDSGDILLVLIILFLLLEGDDNWELVITLGLLLILGLADSKKEGD